MIFQSFNFLLIFLPLTLAFYYLAGSVNLRKIILIVCSFIFYAWGNPFWGMLLISAAIVDFSIAQKIHDLNLQLDVTKDGNLAQKITRKKKLFLLLTIIFNISLLSFFKYWDWLVDVADLFCKKNGLILFDLTVYKHHIPFPPAISFYTFETLSYSIDIYRRKFTPTRNFTDYLAFLSFFPKLVAGPIKRAHELIPQLTKFHKRISGRKLDLALFMIFWGLFKKLVIADNLGHLVDMSYKNITEPGIGLLLSIAFAYQIYCDFSAYCDIARGTASLFGITLGHNFKTPYFSSNPVEFFQRWNITLSTWIRDYVYIPLGGSKKGVIRNIFNLFFTMILVGLWHGAGTFFLLYGVYFSLIMLLYRILPLDKIIVKIFGKNLGKWLSILVCSLFIPFGMILFWTKSAQDFSVIATSFFQGIPVILGATERSEIFSQLGYGLMLFAIPVFLTDLLGFLRNREFTDIYIKFSTPVKVILYLTMFYITVFFAFRGSYDFIYFQF
jgi:alginate O-acetyltransferase complex protein AlgI